MPVHTVTQQVDAMQQYNTSASGYEPLRAWAEAHVREMHAPSSPHDVIMTTGSNHAVDVSVAICLSLLRPQYMFGSSSGHMV